ncbi:MAG: ATP-dependent RecD-like DNA helicase [Clostridiales bacterium]|nr:ATP-dependent RecD-like DNA helicase [Clostridiales bacterium]
MEISGVIQSIIYRNEDNGYSVLDVLSGGKSVTVVGIFAFVNEGEYFTFTGDFTHHIDYGSQFKATGISAELPESAEAMERYLSSGAVKGIGFATARQIVAAFGDKTFEILENDPQKLTQLPGIGKKKAQSIGASFKEQNQSRKTMMFLQQFELGGSQAVRIYKRYGENTIDLIRANPYRLVYDIDGIGFKTADGIAAKLGAEPRSEARIGAGLIYVLQESAAGNGHVYLPRNVLVDLCMQVLHIDRESIDACIDDLVISNKLSVKQYGDVTAVYLPYYFSCEGEVAQRLSNIIYASRSRKRSLDCSKDVEAFENLNGITLAQAQKEAINIAVSNDVCVVTGGPGTGKTTILNCLLFIFDRHRIKAELAAPTGRAAKRMSDATGREARTLHRLLEYGAGNSGEFSFQKDDDNPIEADAIVIDEMSMVDISLMRALLRAVNNGTRLIMVGDADQLSSVGAGDVLRDIILSGHIPVARLTEIFRQGAGSAIISNAHKINRGEMPELTIKDSDFFFEKKQNIAAASDSVVALVERRLPSYFGFDKLSDIQVLCPMKKGDLGVNKLNERLQATLNPPAKNKPERKYGSTIFRQGDKVMQIKNDYQLEWIKKNDFGQLEEGIGVYNGDIGYIAHMDNAASTMTIRFDDGRVAEYDAARFEELDLAYALSVHKSQGSEFTAVVLPLLSGPPMLMTRNLLYTAVTRAKKLVIIVGSAQAVSSMVKNDHVTVRYSALSQRISALMEIDDA